MVWRAAAAIELGHLRGRRVRDRRPAAPAVAERPIRRQPARRSTAHRAWSGVRRRPSSTFPTATWRRTAATRCTRSATTTSTDGTSGRGRRSRPTNASSACANPSAVFYGQPITVDDVLASRVIAAPLHLLEIVMPCSGGAAFVVTTAERARDLAHRPVRVAGFGERLTHKTPDVRGRDAPHAGARRRRAARSAWPGSRRPTSTWCSSTTATRSPRCSPSRTPGFCGEGEGMAFVQRPRPLVPRRLPVQHPRRPAGHGPDRV